MLASKIVGRGGRKARRLSLTRTPALFPLFRRRRCFLDCVTQTKGSDAVSVNNPPAFKNSKSGLRCATEEPMFKSSIVDSYTNNILTRKIKLKTNKTYEKLQSIPGAHNTAAILCAILNDHIYKESSFFYLKQCFPQDENRKENMHDVITCLL